MTDKISARRATAPFKMLFQDLWEDMKERHTLDLLMYGYIRQKRQEENAVMDVQERKRDAKGG